jgi:hypothetical protein
MALRFRNIPCAGSPDGETNHTFAVYREKNPSSSSAAGLTPEEARHRPRIIEHGRLLEVHTCQETESRDRERRCVLYRDFFLNGPVRFQQV